MGRQVLGAVFTAACLCSSAASAQFALGAARTPGVTIHRPDPPKEEPAPPPARPSHSHHHTAQPPAPGADLFLAGPDTYVPHNNRRRSRFTSYPGLSGYVPTAYTPGVAETVIVREPIIIEVERPPREPQATDDREAARKPDPVAIDVTPPKAKTLYVIPRCYAGDKRPSADQLPAGCDLSLLRVIPATAP
jgi:hypothetical protein